MARRLQPHEPLHRLLDDGRVLVELKRERVPLRVVDVCRVDALQHAAAPPHAQRQSRRGRRAGGAARAGWGVRAWRLIDTAVA